MVIYFRCVCVFLEKLVSTIVFVLKRSNRSYKGWYHHVIIELCRRKKRCYIEYVFVHTNQYLPSVLVVLVVGRRMRMWRPTVVGVVGHTVFLLRNNMYRLSFSDFPCHNTISRKVGGISNLNLTRMQHSQAIRIIGARMSSRRIRVNVI